MSSLILLLNRVLDLSKFFLWLPPLAARITVGWVFVESGWGKLHHLDKVAAFFADLGLPAPAFQAHLVATMEFSCGLLLLAGLFTRFASVPLGIIMVVALKTAKKDDIHSFSDLIAIYEYLYILLLAWLAVAGAGAVSLDALLFRKLRRNS